MKDIQTEQAIPCRHNQTYIDTHIITLIKVLNPRRSIKLDAWLGQIVTFLLLQSAKRVAKTKAARAV